MTKKRVEYIDITKAFAIFCVLLGHSIDWSFPGDASEENGLFQFIYSFHMPLFMMLSGMFLSKSFALSFREMLQRRFVQLILPVVSFSLFYFAIQNIVVHPLFGGAEASMGECMFGGDLWFLKYLFVDIVIAWISMKLFRKDWLAATIPTALLFCLTRTTIFRLLPYLWIGYFIYKHHDILQKYNKQIALISLLCFGLFLCYWQGSYDFPIRFVYMKTPVHIDMESFRIVLIRLGVGMSGSIFFMSLFSIMTQFIRPAWLKTYLCDVGRNTLGIYSLQLYILEKWLGSWQLSPEIGANNGIKVIVAIIMLIVINLIVEQIAKNRITALFLLGRK